MRARFSYFYHRLSESFWFLPSLMTVTAIALSAGTLALDHNPPASIYELLPWSEGLSRSNARLIMSTVSGSIITAASLVFSLTLVSLTLAARQLGPRLLSMFMRDRITQVVLGTFVGTFIFALLVLANLGESEGALVVPRASIFVALLLTLLSFGLLIAFIHHLAKSLCADVVVARLAQSLGAQITELLKGKQNWEVSERLELDLSPTRSVQSSASGYVQTIDYSALTQIARSHEIVIVLPCRAGHFVFQGESIAEIRGEPERFEDLENEIHRSIVLGPTRTDAEDPEYAFQAIVEIALRALSPGVNDPYTALTCLDWLGEALSQILSDSLPGHVYRDDRGSVRLLTDPVTINGVFNVAFNEIRQAAEGNVAVLIRLAETLARLGNIAQTPSQREIIQHHAEMIARASERSILESCDRADLQRRLAKIETALHSR